MMAKVTRHLGQRQKTVTHGLAGSVSFMFASVPFPQVPRAILEHNMVIYYRT